MKAATAAGRLQIELAGVGLSDDEAGRLARLTLRQRLSLPAQLELVFQGADRDLAEKAAILVGLSAAVSGDPNRTALFAGDVTAVECSYGPDGGLEVRIRGYDPLHRLRKRQSIRNFADLDTGELAERLAGSLGLSVSIEDAGERRRQVVQWRESDFGFLTAATAGVGLYFVATPDAIELFPLSGGDGDVIELALGDDLLEASFEMNGDEAFESVAAVGWDPTTGKRFEESASSARSGRTAGARVPIGDLGGDGGRTLTNLVARDSTDARALAQSGLDRSMAAQLVLRGVATGHAGLRPGVMVRISGVIDGFTGDYLVTEATHTLDAERGYLTAFSTAPPPVERGWSAPVVAPGVVERVDDPDGLGRVTVTLPTLPSIDTEWIRVLLPGVGSTAGMVTLPSPGDEVLVLFPSGDPAAGIVLGGLYSGDESPDFGIVGGEVRRYAWRTRAGHKVELDEAEDRIRVGTPNGSAITLGKDRLSIEAATDLEIAAPGRAIVIRAKSVDFRKAES